MEIVGPMDWDEMVHGNGDEDQRLDHFGDSSYHYGRGGKSINIYMVGGQASLSGKYMVDGCFILTDQEPSSTCHSVGML